MTGPHPAGLVGPGPVGTGLLGAVLAAPVVTAEAGTDPPDATLFPAEEAVIARSVDKRRREFTTVRHLARTALAGLGVRPGPILPGERGAPVWPPGVVGSMTHCAGFRGCAVARTGDLRSIGIDAEPAGPLPEGVLDAIALPAERDAVAAAGPGVPWDRLLFSAKESVYKAWFPLTHRFLDFGEARVELHPTGVFTATVLTARAGEPGGFTGRWICRDGLVVTAIAAGR